jgi:uncharacterized protein YprB with RNaseH-like and TPR domain/predicted nuclease with RNAse H fold
VLERTFLHLPGIGRIRERALWQNGVLSWDALEEALLSGVYPRDLFSRDSLRQPRLFSSAPSDLEDTEAVGHPSDWNDSRVAVWLKHLSDSRHALQSKDYGYFLERLDASEHWRVLAGLISDALYLDIETTGLSIEFNYVTVIGARYKKKLYQWVWPEPLDELKDLIAQAPVVVTFNGRRFDVPFLAAWTVGLPQPRAHIDLLYLARSLGLEGGQKAAEEHFGLLRDERVNGVDGAEAVVLWCRALWGDRQSYKRLLLYNWYDVEMMVDLGRLICEGLAGRTFGDVLGGGHAAGRARRAKEPLRFGDMRKVWEIRRSGLHVIAPKLERRLGRLPVVVGIDLRGNPKNPTGWARCEGRAAESRIVYSDDEILELTLSTGPDLVSIDAPLSLPRGRLSVSDDSPCRAEGGIVRDAERILWSRGIPVYPSLIRHMQGLTQRGINLTRALEESGVKVIESYPGAAQDILGIPRKRVDINILRLGLSEWGFETVGDWTHDQLDAVTSAMVGYFYLADEYEAIGADDEGYMIIPRWTAAMRWSSEFNARTRDTKVVCVTSSAPVSTDALSSALSERLDAVVVSPKDLCSCGGEGFYLVNAKDTVCSTAEDALRRLASGIDSAGARHARLILEGFPRTKADLAAAHRVFRNLLLVHMGPGVACNLTLEAGRESGNNDTRYMGSRSNQDGFERPETRTSDGCDIPTDPGQPNHLSGVESIKFDISESLAEIEDQIVRRLLSTTLA